MKIYQKISMILFIAAALLFAGCGGGSSSSPTPTETGVLLDSPVSGISYRTATKEGVTNAKGEYDYLPGETVTFFIGGLEFPPVKAAGIVTPADIAGDNKTTQTNILQILQTLDSDGIPGNGITIHQDAAAAFKDSTLDVSSATFDDEVKEVLKNIGNGMPLVTEAAANAHFEKSLQSQMFGSWLYSEGDGKRNVLTFIDKTRYIIIHEHADDKDQTAGSVEYGNYTWNTGTGAFMVTLIDESDGFGGLYDEGSTVTSAAILDDTLTLHLVEDEGAFDVAFTRIPNPVDALVGAYILTSEDDVDDIHVLTFVSDSEYVIAHTKNDGDLPLSGEFGPYSYTPTSRVFKVTETTVNSDDEGGLYNAGAPEDQADETMSITASGSLIFSADRDEDPVYFSRISNALAPSYLKSDLTGTWYSVGAVTPDKKGTIADNSFTEAGTLTVQSNGDYRWETKDGTKETNIEEGTLAFLNAEKGTLSDSETTEDLGWYMNAGKDVMTLIFDDTDENDQGTVTFVKTATAYTSDDLENTWYSVGLGTPTTEGSAGEYWAEADTMTVVGGSYAWDIDDEEGALTISTDGKISSSENPEETVGWFMNAGKDVMATVFNDTSSEEQGTILFVKAASACTLTDLTGVWHTTGATTPTEDGSLDENAWAEAGTMIVDAGGKYHWKTNDDENRGTLTVTAEGVVSDRINETLGWYLSAGKDVMILAFNDTEGNEQGIIAFVKQP